MLSPYKARNLLACLAAPIEGPERSMVSRELGWGWRRTSSQGLNLIELMLVVVIMAVLFTRAAPTYFDYVGHAKTVEAKTLAGALWTGVTGLAVTACGIPATVSYSYGLAGLSPAGETTPARWSVSAGESNTIIVDCSTGAITPDGDVFTISGTASDVSGIRVKLHHSATNTPPSRLRCSANGGTSFVDC